MDDTYTLPSLVPPGKLTYTGKLWTNVGAVLTRAGAAHLAAQGAVCRRCRAPFVWHDQVAGRDVEQRVNHTSQVYVLRHVPCEVLDRADAAEAAMARETAVTDDVRAEAARLVLRMTRRAAGVPGAREAPVGTVAAWQLIQQALAEHLRQETA